MENKDGAVQFYKEALKANCENFEAFNRLITNFLITQAQKEELIKELSFAPENIWLKDYFLSRIRSEVLQSSEHEGIIKRKTCSDSQSSHLYLRTDQDESGTTPPRFLTEALYSEDLPLRNARQASAAQNKVQTTAQRPKFTGEQAH